MQSIRALRQQLQGDKVALRQQVWGYRYLRRGLSIYVTWIIIHTHVRPNQVTVAMLLVGVAAAAALFSGWLWLGLALAYANVVLDASDGELARYRGQYSMRGVYLDRINHLLIPGLCMVALALHLGIAGHSVALVVGVLGALCLPVGLSVGYMHQQLYVRPYREQKELFPTIAPLPAQTLSHTPAPGRRLGVHQLRQFVVMLLVWALCLGAEALLGTVGHPILSGAIVAYGVLAIVFLLRDIVVGARDIERRIAALLPHD